MTAPDLRLVLRDRLRTATRDGDAPLVTSLRTILDGIDTAAAATTEVNVGTIEASMVGMGRADVAGRELTPAEVAQIVRAEITALRRRSAGDAATAAEQDRAATELEALLGPASA